ncbi:class I SAM-dependent methyltransferase [uncultured Pseudokineococcus sp.]|uniref:class I SAM-dependent methyltransferase n=1 Tax=uncultured Pseudokineococcus sp. TaxID=1642928 RepID=UPI002629A190|nr:class I SAM-dependent methyltransferase [uncultured Pseudokineococcus sp.]
MPAPSSAAVPAGALRRGRGAGAPLGVATRGTTGVDRLRRTDRWLAGPGAGALRAAEDPLVVDLGFGASPVTTLHLARALRRVRPDVEVLGLEIDPARAARATEVVSALAPEQRRGVAFGVGGFELGGPAAGRRPVLVRAANVLRQYDVADVPAAWGAVGERLAPGGLLLDVTCDELGRRAGWAVVERSGPQQLVLSVRLADLGRPSEVAERLPKALIHANVPGQPVHALLTALDAAWDRAAPLAPWGPRQRWLASCRGLRDDGWPVLDRAPAGGPRRWRLGEVAVRWSAVAG